MGRQKFVRDLMAAGAHQPALARCVVRAGAVGGSGLGIAGQLPAGKAPVRAEAGGGQAQFAIKEECVSCSGGDAPQRWLANRGLRLALWGMVKENSARVEVSSGS